MSVVLCPYLHFRGQAREAMEFYQSVLGGELEVMTFGDAQAEGMPADQVMHSQLETPSGLVLMASDTPDEMPLTPGSTVTLSLAGDDEVLRDWFTALSEGGQITVPMQKQMWGDEFGMFVDRFGINWMANLAAAG